MSDVPSTRHAKPPADSMPGDELVGTWPRERLVNAVLSRKFSPFDRSIDMHVSKVRKKLGDTENDEHIKTVRGVGYIFARPREKAKV